MKFLIKHFKRKRRYNNNEEGLILVHNGDALKFEQSIISCSILDFIK